MTNQTRHMEIKGLHHITLLASNAQVNSDFFTKTLGLRRVKKTVNFDAPDVYHLYYGDDMGRPGSVITYFPFPNASPGKAGTGEAGSTAFSVPTGALEFWEQHLNALGVKTSMHELFGEKRLSFSGPDLEQLALAESENDIRDPFEAADIPYDAAIRGFHSVSLCLKNSAETASLLELMGYKPAGNDGHISRYIMDDGNGANSVDIDVRPDLAKALQSAGSVHHVAFAVENKPVQLIAQKILTDTGYQVTPVIDRDYFYSVYFRTPEGILFEIATNEPGFTIDEEPAHLGEALKLPIQHEHLRGKLEQTLAPIID
jgi:glyoxalase family protein